MEAHFHELPEEGCAALSISIELDNSAFLLAHKIHSQSYRSNNSFRADSINPFRCLKPNTAEISPETQHRSQYQGLLCSPLQSTGLKHLRLGVQNSEQIQQNKESLCKLK